MYVKNETLKLEKLSQVTKRT